MNQKLLDVLKPYVELTFPDETRLKNGFFEGSYSVYKEEVSDV